MKSAIHARCARVEKLQKVAKIVFALLVIIAHNALLVGMPSIGIDDDDAAITVEPASPAAAAPTAAPTQTSTPSASAQSKKFGKGSSQDHGLITSFSNDGPNTVDLGEDKTGTHGNWVKKKDFLMRSFAAQKEIEALASNIQSYRSIYQQKFNSINGDLDTFYKQLGLEQGKIADLFVQLEEYVAQKKQRRIARFKRETTELREQQMAIEQLEETLKVNKEELAQLQADMKSIEELDKSIHSRIQRADEQITTAQKEAARTRDIIQSMWDMLDDKKAKAAYFEIKDGILRRLQTIDTYLQQELLSDVEKVGSSIQGQIKKAREAIKNLEEKGFLVRDRSKRLDEMNAKKAKEAAEASSQQQQVRKRAKIESDRTIFSKIYDSLVNWIVKIYRMITGIFGSSEPTIKARVRVRTPEELKVLQQNQAAPPQQVSQIAAGSMPASATPPQSPAPQVLLQQPPALPVFNVGVTQTQGQQASAQSGMPAMPVG